MRKYGPLVLGFLFLAVPRLAAEPAQGRLVEDVWEAAYLGGYHVGHFRTTTREFDTRAGKVLRTAVQMELTIKRANAAQKLKFELGSDETADGKVVGVSMRLDQG